MVAVTVAFLLPLAVAAPPPAWDFPPRPVRAAPRVLFASCNFQERPSPLLPGLAPKWDADVAVWGGDNAYMDQGAWPVTPEVIRGAYKRLHETMRPLTLAPNVVAVWDDHDYGTNDGDRTYKYREESKALFQEFMMPQLLQEPFKSRAGVYSSHVYVTPQGKKLRVVLLDVRYNKDPWTPYYSQQGIAGGILNVFLMLGGFFNKVDGTMLGQEQWTWLEQTLCSPESKSVDATLVVSGLQMLHEGRGAGESWSLFPHDRARLLDTLGRCKTRGVMLLSGDVHFAEVSEGQCGPHDHVVEITSSGLTHSFETGTVVERPSNAPINVFLKYLMRFCRAIMPWRWVSQYWSGLNALILDFALDQATPVVRAQVLGPDGTPVISREWVLSSLDRTSPSPCHPLPSHSQALDRIVPVSLQLYAARAVLVGALLGLPLLVVGRAVRWISALL